MIKTKRDIMAVYCENHKEHTNTQAKSYFNAVKRVMKV
jgi:hypothetical protein